MPVQPTQPIESALSKSAVGRVDLPFLKRVSKRDLALFAREISTMLTSGLHLSQALGILMAQIKSPYFKQVIGAVHQDIEQGRTFSQALAKHPNVFSRVFINMVFSGESSGQMDKVLAELGDEIERESAFISKIRSALIYPIFVVVIMILVGILATVKIVPQLAEVFTESKIDLPWATKAVIAFSNFLINQWYVALAVLALVVGVLVWFARTPEGELMLDRLLLREPSGVARKIYLYRFTHTMAMLTSAGLPIVRAIQMTSEVIGNRLYQNSLTLVAGELERGVPMSAPLSHDPLFPSFLAQMVVVGEQTGRLDDILMSMANYFQEQSEESLKNISTLFEPLIIVIIGIGVFIIVYAILVPIYQIAGTG